MRSDNRPHPSFSRVAATFVAFAALAWATGARAAWTVVNLHPAGATSSHLTGIRNGQEVGQVDGNTAVWTGTPGSYVTLGPGILYGTDGVEQVGYTPTGPAAWYGTPGSKIDLTPTPPIPYQNSAVALGVFAGFQVGYIATVGEPGLGVGAHAVLWGDSGVGYTDLNPNLPYASSVAYGEYVGQEVGEYSAQTTGGQHAAIWYGSAASMVDLNPALAVESQGYGVFNGRQVGYAKFSVGGPSHAGIWNSSAASWIDIHPAAASDSVAYAISGTAEAGVATVGGVEHASFWNGSAGSWEDLQAYLPAGYTSSGAKGIWVNNAGLAYVAGYAYNASGQPEAMLWVQTVPEPAALLAAVPLATMAVARRRRA
jgi:hypothetical protein